MAATYLPRNDTGLMRWLANLRSVLPAQAKALGVPDAEVTPALDAARALSESIQLDEQKYAEWQAAVAHSGKLKDAGLPVVQRAIDRLRVTPGYSAEVAKILMAVPPQAQAVHPHEQKPQLRGAFIGGKVRIHWTRGALDGIHVYTRKPGEQHWTLLGHDARPPFDDPRPLTGNAPESREYRAIGVLHDQEVGQPSDPVSVTLLP